MKENLFLVCSCSLWFRTNCPAYLDNYFPARCLFNDRFRWTVVRLSFKWNYFRSLCLSPLSFVWINKIWMAIRAMDGMGAKRREKRRERRSLHARWADTGEKKRKLNWSIGSIIDGNQFQYEWSLPRRPARGRGRERKVELFASLSLPRFKYLLGMKKQHHCFHSISNRFS